MESLVLLVATRNPGKVVEFAELLADLDVIWLGLDDLNLDMEVEETGATFRENAELKAEAYAKTTQLLTLADDSGLEVDALDGKPGVYTSRFGGAGLSPQQRYELLLGELKAVPWQRRTARFRCAVALATAEGIIETQEGVCEGYISFSAAGAGGFGYDPVFYVSEHGQTMAELDSAIKNRISHRARALAAIAPRLKEIVAAGGYDRPHGR